MTEPDYVRWFSDIRSEDVGLVGGKNASLGEMYSAMSASGVKVPDGFAVTASAYPAALCAAGAWEPLATLLRGLGKGDVTRLARHAREAREIVYAATGGEALRRQILAAYAALRRRYGADLALAVRSSATAEDLPTASFAGQHESFLCPSAEQSGRFEAAVNGGFGASGFAV
jgi:pyruvate,water dikinase